MILTYICDGQFMWQGCLKPPCIFACSLISKDLMKLRSKYNIKIFTCNYIRQYHHLLYTVVSYILPLTALTMDSKLYKIMSDNFQAGDAKKYPEFFLVCDYFTHEDCKEFSVSDCKKCASYSPHVPKVIC